MNKEKANLEKSADLRKKAEQKLRAIKEDNREVDENISSDMRKKTGSRTGSSPDRTGNAER